MRLPDWVRKLPLSTILLVVLLANVIYDLVKEKRMEWIDYLFIIGIIYCVFDIVGRLRAKKNAENLEELEPTPSKESEKEEEKPQQ